MKAQAAMEFIMTYGWAILVVILAIIALTYFGVLNPENYLKERCIPASGIKCVDHKAESFGVTLKLENNMGNDILIKKIQLVDERNCNIGVFNTSLQDGEEGLFFIDCTLLEGNLVSSDMEISYDDSVNYGVLNTKVR